MSYANNNVIDSINNDQAIMESFRDIAMRSEKIKRLLQEDPNEPIEATWGEYLPPEPYTGYYTHEDFQEDD